VDDDELRRLAVLLVWGGATMGAYSSVLLYRLRSWRRHRDARSLRELLTAVALWLTAVSSATAIISVLFVAPGTDLRSWLVAVALGAFTGAGLVMASEAHSDVRGRR
jgi:hypothetical protein